MSHGYELLSTPLQTTQAYAAFANRGDLMRPYLVKEITNSNGQIVEQFHPTRIRRVAKVKTLDKLYPVFESVVSDSGTGDLAQIPGLRIAGKTGTAKKVVKWSIFQSLSRVICRIFPSRSTPICNLHYVRRTKTGWLWWLHGRSYLQASIATYCRFGSRFTAPIGATHNNNNTFAIAPSLLGLSPEQAKELLNHYTSLMILKGEGEWMVQQHPAPGDTLFSKTGLQLQVKPKSGLLNPHKEPKTVLNETELKRLNELSYPICGE